MSLAAEMTPKSKPVIPLATTTTLLTNPIPGNIQTTDEQSLQLNNTSSTGNKPPHTAPTTNAAGSSSNPFDDNFTQLNDNELFGLEFDKLRLKNEPQINAQHAHNQQTTNYTNFMHSKQDATIVSPSNNNNNNNNTNYKITHKQGNSHMTILNNPNYSNFNTTSPSAFTRTHVKSNSCSSIGLNLIAKNPLDDYIKKQNLNLSQNNNNTNSQFVSNFPNYNSNVNYNHGLTFNNGLTYNPYFNYYHMRNNQNLNMNIMAPNVSSSEKLPNRNTQPIQSNTDPNNDFDLMITHL